jgi:hypothetical protein
MPVYVSPKTRQWATSAVVLGAIYFLMDLQGLFNSHKSFAMFGNKAWISLTMIAIDQILALIFIVGGVAVLKGRTWGRESLTYVSAAAIVMTILSSTWGWITFHDPAFLAGMNGATGASAGTLPANFIGIMMTVMMVSTIVFGLIQIVYCALLYRHMSAEPVEPPPVGYAVGHQDQGAWPPPPAT